MASSFDSESIAGRRRTSALRIIVTSPPGAGQGWLTQSLAGIYGLDLLAGPARPPGHRRGACQRRMDGLFPEGSIYRTRSAYSTKLVDRWMAMPVQVITIIRDPYDLFGLLHRRIEQQSLAETAAPTGRRERLGLPSLACYHDPALGLLTGQFDRILRRTLRWTRDDRVLVVRFEAMRDDPVRTLTAITDRIAPASPSSIELGMRAAASNRLREFSTAGADSPGDSLRFEHLLAFRDWHADAILQLGYAIR